MQANAADPNYIGPLILHVVILVAIIGLLHFAGTDRSCQEQIDAGYREALQYSAGRALRIRW